LLFNVGQSFEACLNVVYLGFGIEGGIVSFQSFDNIGEAAKDAGEIIDLIN
jgi:hypothetical protein